MLGTPLDQSQQYAQEEIFDSEAAQAVVDKLGAGHVLQEGARPREPRRQGDRRPERRLGPAADLPQGPVREGRPRGAEDARRRARGGREAQRRRHGRHHARHQGRRRLHRRDVRARRARRGLPARRRRRQGHVRLAAVRRGAALVRRHRVQLLGQGRPGRRLHARHLLRRPGGDDVLVAVPARRHGRPARRHQAVVQGVQEGPGAPGQEQRPRSARSPARPAQPSQFGVVSTVNIGVDAPTEDAQKLAEFMLSDGYVRWLGLSPQGKYPVRAGDSADPKKFQTAWAGLESGVDTQGAAEPVLRRGLDRVAGRRRRELPALGLRPGPGRADRRAAR